MNANFEKMMETMMEQYMEKMMGTMMEKMFSTMIGTPEVANAEVEKPVKKTYSVEELMNLEEDKAVARHNANLLPLEFICEDFRPKNGKKFRKGLKYNKYVGNKAVWTYNHLMIKRNYPAIKFSDGYYYADSLADLKAFASQFHITENITDEQYKIVKEYWDSKKK
jgi:hypothetical protein